MKFSHVILVNNTGADIRGFDDAIISAIRGGVSLHEELADTFDLKIIQVEDGFRGILNWAE